MPDGGAKSSLSALILPGTLVAVLSVVGYLQFQPELKSARPVVTGVDSMPDPPSPRGIEARFARLWDDPLAVANEVRNQRKAQPARVDREAQTPSDVQASLRQVIEGLAQARSASSGGNAMPDGPKKRVLIMPLFVPGEPFEGASEQRKRSTYAVLSALAVAGFRMGYSERVSYLEVPIAVLDRSTHQQLHSDLVVPLKLFVAQAPRSDDDRAVRQKYAAAFVLWINRSQLGSRPLAVLDQILDGCFGAIDAGLRRAQIDLRIIGPADSDMLIDMSDEDIEIETAESSKPEEEHRADSRGLKRDAFSNAFREPMLLSPLATTSQYDFRRPPKAGPNTADVPFATGGKSNSGLTVVRTIGTDDHLAAAIEGELRLRDAWPRPGNSRHIVLVTESDTHYGRAIARAFENRLSATLDDDQSFSDQRRLHVFTYLQGIDGRLGDPKKDQPDQSSSKGSGTKPDPLRSPPPENLPATGRSQYDYLRRLESYLRRFHDERRNDGEEGITAIGVVGTDVYDKLLVLRALRKQFPRAWFFTTDLDAEAARAEEYVTTRNLLIASHFALELNRHLQRGAPPFRDSYQTSTFLACLVALDEERACAALCGATSTNFWDSPRGSSDCLLEPLVFEIGRTGPYQLTSTNDRSYAVSNVHPASPREEEVIGPRQLLMGFGIAFVLLAILVNQLFGWKNPFREERRAAAARSTAVRLALILGVDGVLLATASAIVVANRQPDGEPFLFFEGISLWPPILIRLATIVVGAILLVVAARKLKAGSSADDFITAYLLGENPTGARSEIWPIVSGPQEQAAGVLDWYRKKGRADRRALRSCLIGGILFASAAWLMMLFDFPLLPYRGDDALLWGSRSVIGASIVMMFLTAFVLDALWLGREFVRRLEDAVPGWPLEAPPPDPQQHVLTVRLIARLTQTLATLAWFPLVLILLMVLARSKTFDLIDFSWPLLTIWCGLTASIFFVFWQLRKAAGKTREAIANRLRNQYRGLVPAPAPFAAGDPAWKSALDDIDSETRGAFGSLTQDPLVQWGSIIFGGSGGLFVLEQLIPFL